MKADIETQIETFRAKLQTALSAAEKKEKTKEENFTQISITMGKKYARIVKTCGYNGGNSVYGFIDLETGDLLKDAGWKVPAKGARGNIYNEKMLAGCCRYGMAYANSYNARPLEEVETE